MSDITLVNIGANYIAADTKYALLRSSNGQWSMLKFVSKYEQDGCDMIAFVAQSGEMISIADATLLEFFTAEEERRTSPDYNGQECALQITLPNDPVDAPIDIDEDAARAEISEMYDDMPDLSQNWPESSENVSTSNIDDAMLDEMSAYEDYVEIAKLDETLLTDDGERDVKEPTDPALTQTVTTISNGGASIAPQSESQEVIKNTDPVSAIPLEVQERFENITKRIDTLTAEVQGMRAIEEITKPVIPVFSGPLESFGPLIEALADGVTTRSVEVQKVIRRALGSFILTYNRYHDQPFSIGGRVIDPTDFEMWTTPILFDIIAHISGSYEVTLSRNQTLDAAYHQANDAMKQVLSKEDRLLRDLKDKENTITSLRATRNRASSEDVDSRLASMATNVQQLTQELQSYRREGEHFVLYCAELDSYVRADRTKSRVTFVSEFTGADAMTIFGSMDSLRKAMPLIAQWAYHQITVNKLLPAKEKGALKFTLIPMQIAFKSGDAYEISMSANAAIPTMNIRNTKDRVIPVGSAASVQATPRIDLDAHTFNPPTTASAPATLVDEFDVISASSTPITPTEHTEETVDIDEGAASKVAAAPAEDEFDKPSIAKTKRRLFATFRAGKGQIADMKKRKVRK